MENKYTHGNFRLKAFDHLCILARQTGMVNDPIIKKTLNIIASCPGSTEKIQKLYKKTVSMIMKSPQYIALVNDRNPFSYPGNIDGLVKIGQIHNPILKQTRPFGLNFSEINQNLLLSGRAGSGKTTLLMMMLIQFIKIVLPFMVLDFKRDYRNLIRHTDKLYIYNWRTFRFNPLAPPPNVDPIYWTQILSDVFFRSFFPNYSATASKSVFMDILGSLLTKDTQLSFPEFDIQLGKILNAGFSAKYKERIRTFRGRIKPMLQVLGNMFDCRTGFPMEELLNKNVVLEFDGVSSEIQTFLVTTIFYWIFTYRINNTQRGSLKHCLVFDEAKMVFSKEFASGSSPLSRLVSTAREFGEGLILSDQMPSSLGDAVLANVYTQISLSLSSMKDIRGVSAAMGLNPEQSQILNSLQLRTGICKMAGRYMKPFIFRLPDMRFDKSVTDEEVKKHMDSKSDSFKAESPKTKQPEQVHVEEKEPEKTDIPTEDQMSLSVSQNIMLNDIRNNPYFSLTERTKILNFTSHMAGKVCRELLEKPLIQRVKIQPLFATGRPLSLYELTSEGEKITGQQNLGQGKGGFAHCYYQHRIKEFFSKHGWTPVIEEYQNGKACDVGLTMDNRKVAIEVAASNPSKELSNIEKDSAAGWNEIWLFSTTEKIMKHIKSEWYSKKAFYPNLIVEFRLISDTSLNSNGGLVNSKKIKGGNETF